jgi:hypothetical protein
MSRYGTFCYELDGSNVSVPPSKGSAINLKIRKNWYIR